MNQLEGEVFDRRKDPVVLGTFESSAFILSLRDPKEFSKIHSFGYHCIPHIGVYGHDYTPSLPLVLLSLPPLPKCLRKLPSDLLNALDLSELVAQKESAVVHTPPATALQLLQQKLRAVLRVDNPANQDRLIARELVQLVLSSACTQLQLNGTTFIADSTQRHCATTSVSLAGLRNLGVKVDENEELLASGCFSKYRDEKRDSTVSFMSVEGENSRRESFMSQCSAGDEPAALVGHDSGIDIPLSRYVGGATGCDSWGASEMDGDDTAVQLVAKKLVKKALHLACKRCEALLRRCSIEYLVANTKRMRITESPSPPPTLFEEDCSEATKATGLVSKPTETQLEEVDSPTPSWRKRGTKRARSESHDVFMMKELQRFRESQLVECDDCEKVSDSEIKRPQTNSRSTSETRTKSGQSAFLRPPSPGVVHSLTSNIGRMSIAEGNSESDGELYSSDTEEEYTVLSAVTKRVPTPVNPNTCFRADGDTVMENCKDNWDNSADGGKDCSGRPTLIANVPTRPDVAEKGTSVDNHPRATQEVPSIPEITISCPTSSLMGTNTGPDETCTSLHLPNIDFFIIVHSQPLPGMCQKFLCNNTNEANLMYHCWLFPELPFDPTVIASEKLSMGVFDPEGVQPVHLDLDDAGIAFYFLDERTVCIHDCHFSPENAQLQLIRGAQLHTFYSAARSETRSVVAFHILPGTDSVEQSIRQCVSKASTLRELLLELSTWFPEVGQQLIALMVSLSD